MKKHKSHISRGRLSAVVIFLLAMVALLSIRLTIITSTAVTAPKKNSQIIPPAHQNANGAANQVSQSSSHQVFGLSTATPEAIKVNFKLPHFEVAAAPTGSHKITSEDAQYLAQAGAPALPIYRFDLALATGYTPEITISDCLYETIPNIRPLPATRPVLRTEELESPTEDAEIYGGTGLFPKNNLVSTREYSMRGVRGYAVTVAPFQYDPTRDAVRVLRSATITVTRSDDALPQLDSQPDLAAIQTNLFRNADELETPPPVVGTLEVVLPDQWADLESTADFVRWKRQCGWTVNLARYPSDTGETADQLLAYLQAQYAETAFSHLLILGDYNAVPPAQHQGGPGNSVSNANSGGNYESMYQKCASDTPYSLLDGEDYYSDVLLSRLPNSTAESLSSALQRLIDYETGADADGSWRQSAIYMASTGLAQIPPYAELRDHDIIAAEATDLSSIYSTKTTFFDRDSPRPTANGVKNAINAGAGLFMYLGHGSCTDFKTSSFGSTHAKTLTNSSKLPFVIAPVCFSGNLDHGTQYDNKKNDTDLTSPSLAQALFDYNGGAAAAILSTDVTYWNPPIVQLQAVTTALAQRYTASRLSTFGAYFTSSMISALQFCETYAEKYGEPIYYDNHYARLHAYSMQLYGDASAVTRCYALQPLTVQVVEDYENLEIAVTVTGFGDGSPVPNAAVCLQVGDDTFVSTRTDSAGQAALTLTESPTTTLTLRVLDASAPLYTKNIFTAGLDDNQDNAVSNGELLSWLESWQSQYDQADDDAREQLVATKASAIAAWQDFPEATAPSTSTTQPTTGTIPAAPSTSLAKITQPTAELQEQCASRGLLLQTQDDNSAVYQVTSEQLTWLKSVCTVEEINRNNRDGTFVYPTIDEIYDRINQAVFDCAPALRPSLVGTSVKGRSISAIRCAVGEESDSPDRIRPELLIAAGIHGNEKSGVLVALRYLEAISNDLSSGSSTALTELLQNCVLWIIPVMNPDGYASSRRTNANGADLNRGFPDGVLTPTLGNLATGDPLLLDVPHVTNNGAKLLQPEQRSVMRWLSARRISAALHFHTGSMLVCYPYGNNATNTATYTAAPDDALFVELAKGYIAATDGDLITEVNASVMYPIPGELMDWQYRYLGTLPLTVEIDLYYATANATRVEEIWQANRSAITDWIGAATNGVSGKTLPYAKLTDGVATFYADAAGRYHRTTSATQPTPTFTITKAGYDSNLQPDGSEVPEFAATTNSYIPGQPFDATITAANGMTNQANRIVRLTLPNAWTISSTPASATRTLHNNTYDLLYDPTTTGSIPITLSTPNNDQDEARLTTTLFTAKTPAGLAVTRQFIPPAAQLLALDLATTPSLLVSPGIAAQLPTNVTAYTLVNGCWSQATQLRPGIGYLFTGTTATTIVGWKTDPAPIQFAPGWHLVGPTFPHRAPDVHHFAFGDAFIQNTAPWNSTAAVYMVYFPSLTTICP